MPLSQARVIALTSAVQLHAKEKGAAPAAEVIKTADVFAAYIEGAEVGSIPAAPTSNRSAAGPPPENKEVIGRPKPKSEEERSAALLSEPAKNAENPVPAPKPAVSDKAVTADDVHKAIVDLIHDNKKPRAEKVLTKFGAKKLTDIKPADYSAVLLALKQASTTEPEAAPASDDALLG